MGSDIGQFGAIFTSSSQTRDECLNQKLVGLPGSFINFVKSVKAGMIMFIFDYSERQLYGVFEATSDGGIEIVPHAYSSSGKLFPAQVQFNVIWNCRPLSEDRFRDAIRENYYERYKFSFGLSKKQVTRLLTLFDSRRAKVQKTLTREFDKNVLPPSRLASVEQTERDESETSQHKEKKTADISTFDLLLAVEDYIPLSGPGSPESVVEDYIPLSSPETLEGSADGRVTALVIQEPLEGTSDHHPSIRGLYSDMVVWKKDVFSRLVVPKQANVKESGTTSGSVKTLEEILDWSFNPNEVGNSKKRKERSSVFSRLGV